MKINFTRAGPTDSALQTWQWSMILTKLRNESGLPNFGNAGDNEFSKWLESNYEIRLLYEAEHFNWQISGLEMSEKTHLLLLLKYSAG